MTDTMPRDGNNFNNFNRNYYAEIQSISDGLKYRLGADDIIKEMADRLKGTIRDHYGRVTGYDENLRLMNDLGVYNAEFFAKAAISKITTLTKYINEERINRHMKWKARTWAFLLTLNRKNWEVRDKDVCQLVLENAIYEAMCRANDGFENNNISRSYQVSENITRDQPQSTGFLGGIRSLFGGNRNSGGQ